LKRPKQAYKNKSVQHLASHEPKVLALLEAPHSLAKRLNFQLCMKLLTAPQ